MRFIPAYAGNARRQAGCSASRSVHPRIRGERTGAARGNFIAGGSSPHTRGTQRSGKLFKNQGRFIPAYAGNARRVFLPVLRPAVHPRIRGERRTRSASCRASTGSSPHTRGTRTPGSVLPSRTRFIPAYAGNARGMRNQIAHGYGSSPHTRGTHLLRPERFLKDRFIPAYAGNASLERCHDGPLPVHPRIRGERFIQREEAVSLDGSSPHTRGTHIFEILPDGRWRFIPAYAGNAERAREDGTGGTVHPRIRGERQSPNGTSIFFPGSSPHTRGTPISVECWPKSVRFIPAYAGNAINTAGVPQKGPVHPRIRGERRAICRRL